MAEHGGNRRGSGRPGLLSKEEWDWCLDLVREMRNKIEVDRAEGRSRKRDPLDAQDRAELKGQWDQINDLKDLRHGDRSRILAFAPRLEKAAKARDYDAYDKILAEAGALAPRCEALIYVRGTQQPTQRTLLARRAKAASVWCDADDL
jgi:hypothetical protein